MKFYQPVYIVTDGHNIGHAPSLLVYRTHARAKRALDKRYGVRKERGEHVVGGFINSVLLHEDKNEPK